MDRRAGINVTRLLDAAAGVAAGDLRPGDAALFILASDTIGILLGAPADDVPAPARKFTTIAVATTAPNGKPAAPEHRHKYGASGTCMTAGCGAARKNKVRGEGGAPPLIELP